MKKQGWRACTWRVLSGLMLQVVALTALALLNPAWPEWGSVAYVMAAQALYLNPDLTLAQLARKLLVPVKQLSGAINRVTGENVSRYINNARVKAAQGALLKGDNVTTAMLAAGFNTKSNFNREFLRVVGASPSEWLERGRAMRGDAAETGTAGAG